MNEIRLQRKGSHQACSWPFHSTQLEKRKRELLKLWYLVISCSCILGHMSVDKLILNKGLGAFRNRLWGEMNCVVWFDTFCTHTSLWTFNTFPKNTIVRSLGVSTAHHRGRGTNEWILYSGEEEKMRDCRVLPLAWNISKEMAGEGKQSKLWLKTT